MARWVAVCDCKRAILPEMGEGGTMACRECGEDWVETGLLILALRVLSKNLSTLDPKAVDESRDTLARAIAVVGRRTREGVV